MSQGRGRFRSNHRSYEPGIKGWVIERRLRRTEEYWFGPNFWHGTDFGRLSSNVAVFPTKFDALYAFHAIVRWRLWPEEKPVRASEAEAKPWQAAHLDGTDTSETFDPRVKGYAAQASVREQEGRR